MSKAGGLLDFIGVSRSRRFTRLLLLHDYDLIRSWKLAGGHFLGKSETLKTNPFLELLTET